MEKSIRSEVYKGQEGSLEEPVVYLTNATYKSIDPRETRRHKLNSWLTGWDIPRWENDDKRILRLDEFNFWPDYIKEAEQKYFEQIDAEYEASKTKGV